MTPASPKPNKTKDPNPGIPIYGCEHIQRLLTKSQDVTTNTIQHYKMLLRVIFDNTPIIPQTSKSVDRRPVTSLIPNYLCLQCPTTTTAKDRLKHGKLKAHMFYVDSRSGGLFCQMCDDFVWDPTLEELRLRKIGTGSFSSRKRKRDEPFTDPAKDDTAYMSINTTAAPCRATGLRGIFNMGSTCFMSVILQSFVHNPLLRNFYLRDGHQVGQCTQDNCLSCGMDELFQAFYSEETTVSYVASKMLSDSWLCQQAAFSELAGYDEHDAHEYFQFLAEELHRTNRQERHASPTGANASNASHLTSNCDCIVHQTFYGKFQSTLTCQNCGVVTTSVEPFLDLSLAIDSIAKRQGNNGGESSHDWSQPLTLQRCLDPTGSKEAIKHQELAKRALHSVQGHYISYSRVGNQWFKFDDHKVTMASESHVLGAEAFLLFYIIRSLAEFIRSPVQTITRDAGSEVGWLAPEGLESQRAVKAASSELASLPHG
ncbi:hypothetical protein V493_05121 [Pseudogymnoascus sp. VKM F-4281 (FW-2241)]|nr:hypothetical protein V493_05121 [Pseudogymnoascus sp. VKM F-4281 (FW-2241)]